MQKVVISGTGLFIPPESISNQELAASLNQYVEKYNADHADAIAAGTLNALGSSDADFIVKASGIENRYVMNKAGILDTAVMCPMIKERPEEEISVQAEMAVAAAKEALANAKKLPSEIDAVINSCTYFQRAFPGIAIEVQQALGISGYAYDMSVACSSVTFGIQAAVAAIQSGSAKCVLLINPELTTPQVNFSDRESHFIFGDVATAMVIETAETCNSEHPYEILDIKLKTQFSNNIRSDFGYLNRAEQAAGASSQLKLFHQQGRKVFREVIPFVEELILQHLQHHHIDPKQLRRLWLHQANINMNRLIATRVLGHEPTFEEAPVILNEFANTASSGSAIVFHKYHRDLNLGDLGILCSFGAGYSAGNIILQKV